MSGPSLGIQGQNTCPFGEDRYEKTDSCDECCRAVWGPVRAITEHSRKGIPKEVIFSWAQWQTSIIPVAIEAEAGGW